MDKYKFILEDVTVSNPDGWKDFELRLKRDDDIAGLLISSTNKFTFKEDGYDFIKDRFDDNYNDKINTTIEVLEDNTYVEKYKGVIILTDVLFNLEKKTAQATIEDANFQGAIQSNKNIKSYLNTGITKNGVQVSTIAVYNLDYFNDSGSYQSLPNRRAYLLKDALDFIVRFMTDDIVKGIQSDYLDDITNFDGYLPYITTGEAIRLQNSDAPNVSFSELITFLSRTHDLTFDFVTVSGEIVMRIEERAFFFQANTIDTFRDLTDLTLNIDSDKIASHLEVGNNTTEDSGNCSSSVKFFSFQKEDYALRGKGNIDKLIDLTTDFVTDSNVIEFIVANLSADTYDENIIIVQVVDAGASGFRAAKFIDADYCSGDPYYNANFTNDKIINRLLGAVPGAIIKQLSSTVTPALAEQNIAFDLHIQNNINLNPPVPATYRKTDLALTNEIYDLGGYYNTTLTNQNAPGLSFYDIPWTGKFSFKAGIHFKIEVLQVLYPALIETFLEYGIWVYIKRTNAAVTQTREELISPTQPITRLDNPGGLTVVNFSDLTSLGKREISGTMDCQNGDKVFMGFVLAFYSNGNCKETSLYLFKNPDTFFECSGSEKDGGVYDEFDPNSFRAKLYRFSKNVSLQRSDNIRDNTRSSVKINELSDTTLDKTVWIEEMVNNVETGETSFTMIN